MELIRKDLPEIHIKKLGVLELHFKKGVLFISKYVPTGLRHAAVRIVLFVDDFRPTKAPKNGAIREDAAKEVLPPC
jgi:hypothetical protein